ncbi:MAG: hypothetical protein HQK96_00625 [Nitrospirae bacterium]|nr:hypothetical protein [Nitrospirota bacterium]
MAQAETMQTADVAPAEYNEQPPYQYAEAEAPMPAAYAQTDTPITPEVRDVIAENIRVQLEQEKLAANASNPGANDGQVPKGRVRSKRHFVVASNLDVVTTGGGSCVLSAGDVIRLNGTPPEGSRAAEARVVSSRRSDCPASSMVNVAFNELQEMDNSMRENIYAGLEMMRTKNGFPSAPSNSLATVENKDVAGMPNSNENVVAMLAAQQNEADEAEKQTLESAFSEEKSALNQRETGDMELMAKAGQTR